jgi:asparagine synthase (glutamine-hydrolysing)
MNVNLNLKNNFGFKWYIKNDVYVKGYLYDENNDFYKDEYLLDYFTSSLTEIELESKLLKANGCFAVIIVKSNNIYLATDRVRSFPLFYSNTNKEVYISDNVEWLKTELNLSEIPNYKLEEFTLTGYTIGEATLFENIKQVQCGEFVTFNNGNSVNTKRSFYYVHLHGDFIEGSKLEYHSCLEKISDTIFQRLINSVNNRMVVVPLSGGYDSRYIAVMLKKLGYENVVCYTYGRPDSHEVLTSKRVAEQLGYKWIFVKYDSKTWNSILSKKGKEFFSYSHNYSSLPHIQEFIAIEHLTQNKLIEDNAVIIPGFCGDLLGGSYLISNSELNKIGLDHFSLSKYIFTKHFNLYDYNGKNSSEFIKNIQMNISSFKIQNKDDLISINEQFFTSHKVAKFIVNSLRVYEYFGYEWRMPLWDNELIEYWYKIPNKYRVNNSLYNDFLYTRLFIKYNIAIDKSQSNKKLRMIKQLLPKKFRDYILYILNKYLIKNKRNFNSFIEFGEKLLNEIDNSSRIEDIYINSNINHIFSIWFVEKFLEDNVYEK